MDEADPDLMRLLALEDPPARDPAFELAVAAGLRRRLWLRESLDALTLAAIGLVAIWAAAPWLADAGAALIRAFDGAAPLMVGVGAALYAVLMTQQVLAKAEDSLGESGD